jgi:multiple sugar transport system permease protein
VNETSGLYWLSFKNTVIIWFFNFVPQIGFALILASWFTDTHLHLKAQGAFKVMIFMPNIITAATLAILFYSLFNYPIAPVNTLLQQIGLINKPIEFYRSTMASRNLISFIQFWMWYGYTMIILISGVLGINPEIFEAAEIDGATDTQIFFQITLPNLRTILTYTLITSLIGGLSMYDIPKMLNNGNPNNATLTANMFIYNQAFQGSYMYARAAAASMIMFVIIAFFSAIVFFLMRDRKA